MCEGNPCYAASRHVSSAHPAYQLAALLRPNVHARACRITVFRHIATTAQSTPTHHGRPRGVAYGSDAPNARGESRQKTERECPGCGLGVAQRSTGPIRAVCDDSGNTAESLRERAKSTGDAPAGAGDVEEWEFGSASSRCQHWLFGVF